MNTSKFYMNADLHYDKFAGLSRVQYYPLKKQTLQIANGVNFLQIVNYDNLLLKRTYFSNSDEFLVIFFIFNE